MVPTASHTPEDAAKIEYIGIVGGDVQMDPLIGTIIISAFDWAPNGFASCQGQSVTINQYEALYSLIATIYGQQNNTTFNLPNLSGRVPVGMGQLVGGGVYQLARRIGAEASTLSQANLPVHSHNAVFQATTGQVPVAIPATTGNLGVTASLPLATAAGGTATVTPVPAGNATNYIGAVKATVPAGMSTANVTFTGLFSNSTTPPTGGASSPVTTAVTGTAGTAATTANITAVTGGAVSIGSTGGSAPFSNIQPSLVLNFIIALNGIYPDRPN